MLAVFPDELKKRNSDSAFNGPQSSGSRLPCSKSWQPYASTNKTGI